MIFTVKMVYAQFQKKVANLMIIFVKIFIILVLFHSHVIHVETKVHGRTTPSNKSANEGQEKEILDPNRPKIELLLGSNLIPTSDPSLTATVSPEHFPVVPWCKAYMHAYASAAARFVECAIHHARPLSFCENCVEQYAIVVNLVKEIHSQDKVRPRDPDSIPAGSCINTLLSSDMINVVGATDNFINQLWKNSDCDACFDHYKLVNGTVEFAFANSTLEFERKYNETSNCMGKYMETPVKGEVYNQTACDECYELYEDLNNYYTDLDYRGGVCMDIVDTMNSTRNIWSKKFKCLLQQKDLAAVLTVTGVFCLLPIVFYSAAKLHGAKQHMKILKQRRMSKAPTSDTLAGDSVSHIGSSPPPTVPQTDDEQTDDEVRRRYPDTEDDSEAANSDGVTASGSGYKPSVVFDI